MPDLAYRRPVPEDLHFVADLFSRPEVVAHRPDPQPDPPEISADRLARDIAHWDRHGYGRWTVTERGCHVALGGVTTIADTDEVNISYHVHPDHWRRGIAGAVAARAVAHAFEVLKVPLIRGLVREANPASASVLLKLGFLRDGVVEHAGQPTIRYVLAHP